MVFVIPDENRVYHDLDDIRAFVAIKEEAQKKAQEERTLVSVATTASKSSKSTQSTTPSKSSKSTKSTTPSKPTTTGENSLDAKKADRALKRLSKSRCDSYNGWLNVALQEFAP